VFKCTGIYFLFGALIVDTNIDHSFRAISKDSEKEKDFIAILIKKVSNLNLSNIQSKDNLENLV